MNILVVNDDGINAKGISILAKKLTKYGNVYVCAPDRGRSAASHSVILHSPLEMKYVDQIEGVECYKTNGMPCDCVRLATSILDKDFDVVFSGVNDGLNIGTDIIYSGTVAAAREAVIEGIPGVAISTDFSSFDIVEKELDNVLDIIFNNKLYSSNYILNVNFPIKKYTSSIGIKVCRQGVKTFNTTFGLIENEVYKVFSEEEIHDTNSETDVYLADKGYVTFVPLKIDQTNYDEIKNLNNILK